MLAQCVFFNPTAKVHHQRNMDVLAANQSAPSCITQQGEDMIQLVEFSEHQGCFFVVYRGVRLGASSFSVCAVRGGEQKSQRECVMQKVKVRVGVHKVIVEVWMGNMRWAGGVHSDSGSCGEKSMKVG
ncbi:hypothetical protein VNO80_23261 [Phaseolus coccineus]|uniref:Uncharacterized protein n=1 Tax=Phaseolus coccineus TaxID=3886 RepID=A0AAN9QUS1_PHACN